MYPSTEPDIGKITELLIKDRSEFVLALCVKLNGALLAELHARYNKTFFTTTLEEPFLVPYRTIQSKVLRIVSFI